MHGVLPREQQELEVEVVVISPRGKQLLGVEGVTICRIHG